MVTEIFAAITGALSSMTSAIITNLVSTFKTLFLDTVDPTKLSAVGTVALTFMGIAFALWVTRKVLHIGHIG